MSQSDYTSRLFFILSANKSISSSFNLGLTLNIEWMGPAPSLIDRGTICMWTCGTSCPASFPLWMAIVEALTSIVVSTIAATSHVSLKTAEDYFLSISWILEQCSLGTTRVCPEDNGKASKNAKAWLFSLMILAWVLPEIILQKTQFTSCMSNYYHHQHKYLCTCGSKIIHC